MIFLIHFSAQTLTSQVQLKYPYQNADNNNVTPTYTLDGVLKKSLFTLAQRSAFERGLARLTDYSRGERLRSTHVRAQMTNSTGEAVQSP